MSRSKEGSTLCQKKYTLHLLQDTCLSGAKPCNTSMQPHLQLHKGSRNILYDPTTYRRLIGRLLYRTHSRPKISYVVSKLIPFLSALTNEHIVARLRVLKYLKANPGNGLFISSSSTLTLKGFSESDWGACPKTRRSTTSLCFFSWKHFD